MNLPEGWTLARLGDLLPLNYGKALPAGFRNSAGSIPVFGSSGIVGTHDVAVTSGPTLVVGRKGAIGEVHLCAGPCWPIDTAYYANAPVSGNIRYFAYLLRSLRLVRLDRSTAIPSLVRDDYNRIEVPVAPPDEQDRIVAEIEKQFTRIDAAGVGLSLATRKLATCRAAVLAAAIDGRLVTTEASLAKHEHRPYKSGHESLAELRAQRNGKISAPALPAPSDLPEGWAWASADMVGDILLGRQRAPQYLTGEHSHPYLRVANVKDDTLDLSDVEEMDFDPRHLEKYRLQAGDILVSEGQSPHLVGQSAIYNGGIDNLCFQKTLHRFRAIPGGPAADFAQIVFRASVKKGIYKRLASITTNIAHLTLEKFRSSPFPLPPFAEQVRIVAEVQRVMTLIKAMEGTVRDQQKRSGSLRQAILVRAFAGTLFTGQLAAVGQSDTREVAAFGH